MLAETSKFNLNLGNILNITKNNLCRGYMFLYCENFRRILNELKLDMLFQRVQEIIKPSVDGVTNFDCDNTGKYAIENRYHHKDI